MTTVIEDNVHVYRGLNPFVCVYRGVSVGFFFVGGCFVLLLFCFVVVIFWCGVVFSFFSLAHAY